MALGRWGSPLPPGPDSATELSADALLVALRTTFDPSVAAGLDATIQLHLPGDAFRVCIHDGRLDVVRGDDAGSDKPADAVLACSVRTVQDLVFDHRAILHAVHVGDADVEGDIDLLDRFLQTFEDHRADESTRRTD